MPKQVILLHTSLNAAGGGERVTFQFIRALHGNKYEITLATVERTNWAMLEEVFSDLQRPEREIHIFNETPKTGFQLIDSMITTLSFIILLLYIRFTRNEFQINTCGEKVNSISDMIYVNAIPLRSAYTLESTSTFRKILSRSYGLLISPLDFMNPRNTIISNSNFNKNLIKNTFNRESIVIYPPIDLEKIISNDLMKYDCVAVGSRYLPGQNLEIVPHLASKLKGIKFKMIGTASGNSMKLIEGLRKKCQELGVSDQVEILYNQPFATYVSILFSCKVFLRPLPSEPFGISVIEAMASGCIPLVRKGSGPWVDILEEREGKYGFSFEDVEEAALKIRRIVSDKELLEKMQERIRERLIYFRSMDFDESLLNALEGCMRGLTK